LTDGKQGMANQCIGLAEAMGLAPVIKKISMRSPWRQLSPSILRWGKGAALKPGSDPIAPPWPDVLIATGRHSVLTSLWIGEQSPATFRIQIQNPVLPPQRFGFVITPRHDRLKGENVLSVRGAMHRVTDDTIAEGAKRWAPQFAHLPHPLVAVLIGGANGAYRMEPEDATRLGRQLADLSRKHGVGLLITPSRRTGAANEAALRQALNGIPAYIWDGEGDNPYFGLLGLADIIIATPDSINMVSEAASTGKPVMIAPLPGGSRKFNAFHQEMITAGITRSFEGQLEHWEYPPLKDTQAAAAQSLERIRQLRG
jgi:mitochondrial fission protein ELM1